MQSNKLKSPPPMIKESILNDYEQLIKKNDVDSTTIRHVENKLKAAIWVQHKAWGNSNGNDLPDEITREQQLYNRILFRRTKKIMANKNGIKANFKTEHAMRVKEQARGMS
jgi:hypothetical protein